MTSNACVPLVFVMGMPRVDAGQVGTLLGIKRSVNELVGYAELSHLVASGGDV